MGTNQSLFARYSARYHQASNPNLDNLNDLVDDAKENKLGLHIVRNCPYDCPTIPEPLKDKVAIMIEDSESKMARQERKTRSKN
jgi:hypothetical protein